MPQVKGRISASERKSPSNPGVALKVPAVHLNQGIPCMHKQDRQLAHAAACSA